jgi:hypothetical protein
MPFGLSCAGATFERLMEYALAGLQWETCIIYLDDIIVFSRTFEEHVTRLQSVFGRMRDAGLKIAPSKINSFSRHGYIKIGLEVKACFNILKNLHKN